MGLLTTFGSFKYTSTLQPKTTSDLILADNGRVVSLMGPAIKGKAFIPQGFDTYTKNAQNPTGQSFEEKIGNLSDHYKKYQARINSIFSAYTILNSNAQINYTKILGINIPGSDFNPGLKIGFDNKTNKLYAFGFYAKRKDTNDLNRYNFEILGDDDVRPFLAGFIVTSKNISVDTTFTAINDQAIEYNGIIKSLFNFSLIETIDTSNFKSSPESIPNVNEKIYINDQKPNLQIYFSFDKNDDFYWKKVLNTNIDRLDELGYAFINTYEIQDEYEDIIKLDTGSEYYFIKELDTLDYLDFEKPFSNASSPWFVSQGYYDQNQSNKRIEELSLKDRVKKLFRFHSVVEGEYGNNYIISINPRSLCDNNVYAKFDIYIYDKIEKKEVQSFIDVNLDPNSQNYIRRMIGDKREIFDINGSKRIVTVGEYNLTNNYIWVEVTDEVERGLIPKETIPAGFIEKNKFKAIDLDGENTFYKKNYNVQPVFNDTGITISYKHSWGHKLYKITQSNDVTIDSFRSYSLNKQIKSTKNDIKIKINRTNNSNIEIIKTNNFLNDFYFDEINNENMTNEDIFHLEKISLINEIKTGIINVRTDLSSYINSGKKLFTLNDTKFTNEIFENTDQILEENFPFYYLTLNKSIDLNDDKKDICDIIDTDFFKFTTEMSGGWDGLNIFDIEQKAMTNKGIENNSYIADLYKYALDICLVHENGLNNIIYLSGIYRDDIIKHALNNIDNDSRFRQFFIYDLPLYDIYLNMVDYSDFLERKTGTTQKWSDHIYGYKILNDIDEKTNILNWTNLNLDLHNKYTSSFANYSITRLNIVVGFQESVDLIVPSGIWGLKLILDSQNLTNITNIKNDINLTGITIENIFLRLRDDDPSWETYFNVILKKIKSNVLINRKSDNNNSKLGFNTSRTLSFIDNNNNQSLNSMIMYRLIMNEIKRVLEININRNMIFESIRSKKESLIKYQNMITTIMNQIVNSGLINSYNLRIDDVTTSDEDLLNNVLRGEVELLFPGQKTIITNSGISTSGKVAF